jgi:hypothetical protein
LGSWFVCPYGCDFYVRTPCSCKHNTPRNCKIRPSEWHNKNHPST